MKSPIPYTYDLNTKSAQKVICVTHTDDNSVDVIQLHVVQNGALIDFSGNTIIARMVMSRTHELLSDNVVCEIDEVTKDIMIPIDRKAVSTRKGLMLVEVSVRGVLPQKLTFQFPLLVRVNGSILDDAEITPESQGTIPELLIAAAEELRRVQGFITSDDVYDILDSTLQGAQNVTPSLYVKRKGDNYALVYEDSEDVLHELFDFANLPSGTSDYTDLENKPQINNHTLSGNKSSDDLGLQKKLTAGQNITLESDGTISASGGVTSYSDLTDKPQIVVANSPTGWSQTLTFNGKFKFNPFYFSNGQNEIILGIKDNAITFNMLRDNNKFFYDYGLYSNPPSDLFTNYYTAPYENGIWYISNSALQGLPVAKMGTFINYYINGVKLQLYIVDVDSSTIGHSQVFFRVSYMANLGTWQEITNQNVVSGVVNSDGTITFSNSDGTTFTTTGASVIGADGFSPTATVTQTASGATVSITDSTGTTTANISNGADGSDYVLTAQDKSDIAALAIAGLNGNGVSY